MRIFPEKLHVKSDIAVTESPIDEPCENMLSAVIFGLSSSIGIVYLAKHFLSYGQCCGKEMDYILVLHIFCKEKLCAIYRPLVRRLSATFRIKGFFGKP